MDLMNVLEDFAAASIAQAESRYQDADIERWARLFQLTYDGALEAMESHFENLARIQISDAQWCILKDSLGIAEHDKESYSYFLGISKASKKPQIQAPNKPHKTKKTEYIFKLAHPFDTAAKIQEAAQLPTLPHILPDEETGEECFAVVDGSTRSIMENLVPTTHLTFAVLKKPAEKELSPHCVAPALGIDATLPQHRGTCCEPRQDEYPVPYFFYGTLVDPMVLTRLLSLEEAPIFQEAKVRGGKLGIWGGKYRALVDGHENDAVDGWVYVVGSKEQEDCLRHYEGSSYEVVRCQIFVGKQLIKGLTFRFIGDGVVVH